MKVLTRWVLPAAILLAGCGPDGAYRSPELAPQAERVARPLCIPITSSDAFDGAGERVLWRDQTLARLQETTPTPSADPTREFDWEGEYSEYHWDAPGEADDFSVQVVWAFYEGQHRRLPLSMQNSYPAAPQRDTVDSFRYDDHGRLYGFDHDYVQSDVDDRSERFLWDRTGRLVRIEWDRKDPLLNRAWKISYDAGGRIARWSEDYDGIEDYIREDFVYDENGLLSEWTKTIPGMVLKRVVVAWTREFQPLVLQVQGTHRQPVVKACP